MVMVLLGVTMAVVGLRIIEMVTLISLLVTVVTMLSLMGAIVSVLSRLERFVAVVTTVWTFVLMTAAEEGMMAGELTVRGLCTFSPEGIADEWFKTWEIVIKLVEVVMGLVAAVLEETVPAVLRPMVETLPTVRVVEVTSLLEVTWI